LSTDVEEVLESGDVDAVSNGTLLSTKLLAQAHYSWWNLMVERKGRGHWVMFWLRFVLEFPSVQLEVKLAPVSLNAEMKID